MQTQFPSTEIISIIQKLSPSFWQQPNHCHNYAELAFVTDGIGCFTINNISIPVKKGSIILIPPHLYHCFHDYSAETLEYCIIAFCSQDSQFLANELKSPNGSITYAEEYMKGFDDVFELILQLSNSKSGSSLKTIQSFCLSILQLVELNFSRQSIAISETTKLPNQQPLFYQIYLYIAENCARHLTLQEIAESFHISPSHLSHTFSKLFGYSPIEHLIRSRIHGSFPYLLHSNKSVEQIAEIFGYSTPALYIQQFSKRVGCTPMEYKRRRKDYTVRFPSPSSYK